MATPLTLLWIGLVWLAALGNTYGIDKKSCQDVDFIQRSADAAIAMAQDALDELKRVPLDPNVDRLIGLLFRPADTAAGPDDYDIIEDMKFVYEGVVGFRGKQDLVPADRNEATEKTVNIFCDLSRVQKRPRDGKYEDTVTDILLKGFNDNHVNQCLTDDGTLAFTWSPKVDLDRNLKEKYSPSQVTICPWFYQFARSKALNTWKGLGLKATLATAAMPFITGGWPYTPVDAITLLDKVLLHEFTHTSACGKLDDVPMTRGAAPFFGVAYGWNAATALAKQDDNDDMSTDDGTGKSPLLNSDSFALFASGSLNSKSPRFYESHEADMLLGVRLLSRDPKLYIKDNGWITQEDPQAPSKRDVPIELWHKQTPAAFEGFITSIREERAAAATAAEFVEKGAGGY